VIGISLSVVDDPLRSFRSTVRSRLLLLLVEAVDLEFEEKNVREANNNRAREKQSKALAAHIQAQLSLIEYSHLRRRYTAVM